MTARSGLVTRYGERVARNFVTHTYDRVDPAVVWGMFSTDLPRVAGKVRDRLGTASEADG